jgi:hypothetical protein
MLFQDANCLINEAVDDDDDDNDDEVLDEDKMRCHILDCMAALRRVQRRKRVLVES